MDLNADATRLMRHVKKSPRTGCWLWQGGKVTPMQYGKFDFRGRTSLAHRVAWELFRAPIPKGMTIDHLCRRPSCVNPDHMEVVTMRENVLRGRGLGARNAKKRRCVRGHPYTPENTMKQKNGRCCRKCRREDWANYRRRQAAKQEAICS